MTLSYSLHGIQKYIVQTLFLSTFYRRMQHSYSILPGGKSAHFILQTEQGIVDRWSINLPPSRPLMQTIRWFRTTHVT